MEISLLAECSCLSLDKLCSPRFGQFILLIQADPLKLNQFRQVSSVNYHLQAFLGDVLWSSGLCLGHSRTFRNLSQRPSSCMFQVVLLLKSEPSPQSEVMYNVEQVIYEDLSVFGCIYPSLKFPVPAAVLKQYEAATTMLQNMEDVIS